MELISQWMKVTLASVLVFSLVGGASAPVYAQTVATPSEPLTLYPPVTLDAGSQQIPAGVQLRIRFVTPMDARTIAEGKSFLTETADDLWVGNQLILPKATFIRGRVAEVKKPGFFSKGGLIKLSFDHILLPSGDLMPMDFYLDAHSDMVKENALYEDPGMGKKLDQSVDKGVDQFHKFYNKGVAAGEARGGGVNMLLTVPTNAVAGALTGTAVTTANAAKAVFGKGDTVNIQPGDEIVITFGESSTLPAY